MTDKKEIEKMLQQISNEIDLELFREIKIIQSLPDEVVIDFLKSKGKLYSTNFKNKIFQNVR